MAGRTTANSSTPALEVETDPGGDSGRTSDQGATHDHNSPAESDAARTDPPREDRAPQPARRSTFAQYRKSKTLMLLTGLTAAFALIAVVAFFKPGVDDVSNETWVDTAATAEVTAAARDALQTVFSYKFDTIDQDQDAARAVLTEERRAEYDSTAEQTKQSVLQTTTVTTSTVTDIGVTVLNEDRAELIASLDVSASQDSVDRGTVQTPAAVTMERVDGKWLIAEIDNR
ncbi:hypothetical protein [Rhodococcoides kroppenstedtii]|uniref:hypothetical protein n=1 Tax=Rhodococcoides kroppenstedtii TaxID=293050 RepID=UPI003644CCA6